MSTQGNLEMEVGMPLANGSEEVEKLEFEPIKGYPMLHWRGKRPFRSTHFYPAQLKEVHGSEVEGWRNKVFWGDNLQVMSHLLKQFRSKVGLVYIDPPFDSKADYARKIQLRGKEVASDQTAFEEKQYTDIWTNDEYLQFMYERLILIRELLQPTGTIYVHVDATRGHHIRSILDEVFGAEHFRNEIIWHYENKLGTGGQTLDSRHDNLLVYTKGKSWTYNPIMVPVKDTKLQPVTQKIDGKRVWLRDEQGKRLYQDSRSERPLGDVWTIPIINPVASERLGYPTQKPEALLDRIIRSSSELGDIVFDCFMGSATAQAVAMKLGRRFLGADINLGAIQVATKRLISVSTSLAAKPSVRTADMLPLIRPTAAQSGTQELPTYYTGLEIYNVNFYDVFRNPLQARDLILEALEIQKLAEGSLFDGEKDGRLVKIMPTDRIATRADLTPLISGFDYRSFERRHRDDPRRPVERITLICMGHEPDLAAALKAEVKPYEIDVEVFDILRNRGDLQFKRDSEARVTMRDGYLAIEAFYPMNLLQKLSLEKGKVEDWREMVDSVMIDWNFDGAIFTPTLVDVPEKNSLVMGRYQIPGDAGTIRVKITDVLSESVEVQLNG